MPDLNVQLTAQDLERFHKKVARSSDPAACWLWTGGLNAGGRGRFTAQGVTDYAYRWAVRIEHGHLPTGEVVRHLCGNPRCVRPDHLDPTGGQRENNLDTVAHGRHKTAVLNAEDARRIRERYAAKDRPLQRHLADEYRVTASAISDVVTCKTWPRAGGPIKQRRKA